jgi:hypothetical protein
VSGGEKQFEHAEDPPNTKKAQHMPTSGRESETSQAERFSAERT